MPSGGILQLSSSHANTDEVDDADARRKDYLHAQPKLTYFKTVYRGFRNFSMETIPVQFDTKPQVSFDKTTTFVSDMDNIGHLMRNVYLVVDLPVLKPTRVERQYEYARNLALNMIEYVELRVGGQVIQEFSSDWIYIYYKRYMTYEKYLEAIRNVEPASRRLSENSSGLQSTERLYVFLPFYFSKSVSFTEDAPSTLLPFLNIQYQSIYLTVRIRPVKAWLTLLETNPQSPYVGKRVAPYVNDDSAVYDTLIQRTSLFLEAQCIYLDTKELAILRTKPILDYVVEYPFETTVRGVHRSPVRVSLQRRHALKEIWIVGRRDDVPSRNTWNVYGTLEDDARGDDVHASYGRVESEYTPSGFLREYWMALHTTFRDAQTFQREIVDRVDMYLNTDNNTGQYLFRDMPARRLRYVAGITSDEEGHTSYNRPVGDVETSADYLYCKSFSAFPTSAEPSGFCRVDGLHPAITIHLTQPPPMKPLPPLGIYNPHPAEFKPYDSTNASLFAYQYEIKVIFVHLLLIRIKGGILDVAT